MKNDHVGLSSVVYRYQVGAGGLFRCILIKEPRLLAAGLSSACSRIFLGINIQPVAKEKA